MIPGIIKKLQGHTIFRWSVPSVITLIWLFLLGHHSPNPRLFTRYSYEFFLLLLTMGIWLGLYWWIALNTTRYHSFLRKLFHFPPLSLIVAIIGSLILTDLFIDLTSFFSISPLIPTFLMGFLVWLLKSTERSRLPKMKNLLSLLDKAALLISSIIIGLVISELVFRWFVLEPQVPTSEQGFIKLVSSTWPRQISVQKEANTFRILGLSDSYGRVGGSENYHYLLEALLQTATSKVEVVNLSVVDYGPGDELEIFKRFGARYQPNLVLHGLYVGNDLTASKTQVMKYLGIGVRPPPDFFAYRPRNFLVIQWLKFYLTFIHDQALRRAEAESGESASTFSKENFLRIEQQHLDIARLDPPPAQRWPMIAHTLDEIHREVERIGAKHVIIIHPDQFQVEEELRRELERTYNLDMNQYDLDLPQRFLLDYCFTKGILCLDLLPTFRARGAAGGLYLLRDTHYNKEGNALAAQLIFNFLEEKKLLP